MLQGKEGAEVTPSPLLPPSQPPPSYLTQTAKQPSSLPRVRLTEFQLSLPLLPLPSPWLQTQGEILDPWPFPYREKEQQVEQGVDRIMSNEQSCGPQGGSRTTKGSVLVWVLGLVGH